ncbi:MAG: lipoyl synthase [Spirochaetales bacterium]|nr:lipoyl synthase [Spirochaetales bacterium]
MKSQAATAAGLETEAIIRRLSLATVCAEAACPNRGECFSSGRAAFLAMGPVCTRACAFCLVRSGKPSGPDPEEPQRIARAAAALRLRHVVVTSVTRDDLPDGGAGHFVRIMRALRDTLPDAVVELLVPDFRGDEGALRDVVAAGPDVLNHNLETVPRLYPDVRPGADYRRSLSLLKNARSLAAETVTKSGLMVGLGETEEEIAAVMADLRSAGCDMITIGQYLAPSRNHYPIREFVAPVVFDRYRELGLRLGFRSVASGPFVRSSYHADTEYRTAAESMADRKGASHDV